MAEFDELEVIEILSSADECPEKEPAPIIDGMRLLNEFIAVCEPLLKRNQPNAITKLLTDKFSEASTQYTQSEQFRTLLRNHVSDLLTSKRSVYIHIQDVKTALMRASSKRKVELNTVKVEQKATVNPTVEKETVEAAVKEEEEGSLTEKQSNDEVTKDGREGDQDVEEETFEAPVKEESLTEKQSNDEGTKDGREGDQDVEEETFEAPVKEEESLTEKQSNGEGTKDGIEGDQDVEEQTFEAPVKEEESMTEKQSNGEGTKDGREGDQNVGEAPQSGSFQMSNETFGGEEAPEDSGGTVEIQTKAETMSIGLDEVAESSTQLPKVEDNDSQAEEEGKGKGSKKQIRKLERMLGRLDKAIKKLQERELTLDEMDESDSTHMQEYQLRRRFVKVYNMLCKLNQCTESTGRVIEQRVRYEGTRFPEINRRLERLVNKKDFFPDFHDIYKAIYKTNLKKNLGLDKRRVNSIAQEAFEDIGGRLQKRRQQDFVLNFSSHSTIDFVNARDSVDEDPELKKKLKENKVVAKQNIKDVEDTFVKRQEECEKNGINLEASEHSESDSEGPSDNDGEDGPAAKKRCLDKDNHLEGSDDDKDSSEDEKDGMDNADDNVTTDFKSTDRPNSDLRFGQVQQTVNQQHGTAIPETNAHTKNAPSNMPGSTISNSAVNANLNNFSVSQDKSFRNFTSRYTGNVPETPAWADLVTMTMSDSNACTSPPPLVQGTMSPNFDTPEQAVKTLKLAHPPMPSASMPLLITNVCSLSPQAGHFPGPGNNSWHEGKATITKVVDNGRGSMLIRPPRQQQIMVFQSCKSVKLRTSTPITLSFEDTATESSAERPVAYSIPAPSPPPSVSSTQPELDISPDVEEVVEASTKSSLLWQTEQRLKTSRVSPATQQITYTQHQRRIATAHARQVVVSKTSCACNSAVCPRCQGTRQEIPNQRRQPFCVQSTHVSNSSVPSYPPRAKTRMSSYVRPPDRSSPAVVPPRSISGALIQPRNAQDQVFKVKQAPHLPRRLPLLKAFPKWQPQTQRGSSRSHSPASEKACSRKLNFVAPNPVSSVADDDDSDVIILSDSDSDTMEKSAKRAESPDIICISDSD